MENPYVGPRSFRYGEALSGRDREVRDVRDRLIAERILLLYSPSGAGKSSLIEAGVRKELEDSNFTVLPTVRVGHELRSGPGGNKPETRNRYVLSTLISLEGDAHQRDLPDMTLGDYLDERRSEDTSGREQCIFFDQFEELFTLDPTDRQAKGAFLAELGRALRDRNRWALFAMREDFIAQLDPYLGLIPTRFVARYRLDLLDKTAAELAIREPAARLGVTVTQEATKRLVADLSTVRVRRGGAVVPEEGPYVEPVQLQVVCRRLWEAVMKP
jgi:hypothetical protein